MIKMATIQWGRGAWLVKIMGTFGDYVWWHVLFIFRWVEAWLIVCFPCGSAPVGQLFPNILAIGQSVHKKTTQHTACDPTTIEGFFYWWGKGCYYNLCIDEILELKFGPLLSPFLDPARIAPKEFCQMGCVNGNCTADHGTFKCRLVINRY